MKVRGSDALLLSRHCTWHTHMHLDIQREKFIFFFFLKESLSEGIYILCVFMLEAIAKGT